MDILTLALLIAIGSYIVNHQQQRKRIALLASHLGHYQIEKLMEALTEGYLRALGESTPDLRGRKAICEVMVMNRAIGKLITSEQSHMIPSQVQTGREAGMQTLDQALLAAVQSREVDPEDAFSYAIDKKPFARYVPEGTAILKADVTQGL